MKMTSKKAAIIGINVLNVVAIILLLIAILTGSTSCAETDCDRAVYKVNFRDVTGQHQTRYYYLPDPLGPDAIRTEIRNGAYVMRLDTRCESYDLQVGVIEVLSWERLVNRDRDTIVIDNIDGEYVTEADSSTMLTFPND